MVRPPFSLTALVALLLPLATAQDDPNTWVSPTPNDGDHSHIEGTFSVGSIIKLEWQTNFTEINLVIWQDENSTLQYLPNSAPFVGTTYTWTVDLSGQGGNPQFDLKNGHRFFFEFFDAGATSGYESQYINITDNAAAASTSASSTASSTASPTAKKTASQTSATQTQTNTPTSSPTDTNAPTSKGGLSKGAQAGIGVGVAIVGIAAIIGAIAFFTIRRRRAEGPAYSAPPSELPPTDVAKSYYGPPVELPQSMPKYAGRDPSRPMSELPETPGQNISAVSGLHEL